MILKKSIRSKNKKEKDGRNDYVNSQSGHRSFAVAVEERVYCNSPFRLRSALAGFSPLNELSFFARTNALNYQSPSISISASLDVHSGRV